MKNITLYRVLLAVIALVITAYYFWLNPSESDFKGFQCLFYKTTGFYCTGCGGQRAFHDFLNGHWASAFKNNLLIFLAVPLVGLKLSEEFFNKKLLPNFIYSRKFILPFVIFLLVFTILRNLPYTYFSHLRP